MTKRRHKKCARPYCLELTIYSGKKLPLGVLADEFCQKHDDEYTENARGMMRRAKVQNAKMRNWMKRQKRSYRPLG